MTAQPKHAPARSHVTPTKTTTTAHAPPPLVAQAIEPEAAPTTTTHAVVEADVPAIIEVLEDKAAIAGSAIVKFRRGQFLSDRWLVSHAIQSHVAFRVATALPTPREIVVRESAHILMPRSSTSVYAGQRVVDAPLIAAIIAKGVAYSDTSPDAA
jgi:hypothetical protein